MNVEVLVMKKRQLLILLSVENRCMGLELLFSKHTKYLLNIIQQIIQSQRLKAILTILGVASKNTKEWILASLRKIFLRRLYEDIHTVMGIPSKPEIFVQGIQVKPETPKSWIPLCSSLHSYLKLFYKFITYYMFNNNYNIDTWNIRRQIVGYIMSLKRK